MERYVTSERLEELKHELGELKTTKRIEVARRLKRAKELGDLSENSEYAEAREEQAQVERRIYELEQFVKEAKVIVKPTRKTEQVQVGSTLDVTQNGVTKTFTIVGSNEANPTEGFISNESPLGKALIGRKAGDTVTISIPRGTATYDVVNIH